MTMEPRFSVGRSASTTASRSSSAETQVTTNGQAAASSAGEAKARQPVSAASAVAFEVVRFQALCEQACAMKVSRHVLAHGAKSDDSDLHGGTLLPAADDQLQ